jgi:hypothetical protein
MPRNLPVLRRKDAPPSCKPVGAAQHVARLFVPGYEGGIVVAVAVPRSRNSDARRRLARLFEPRRLVS